MEFVAEDIHKSVDIYSSCKVIVALHRYIKELVESVSVEVKEQILLAVLGIIILVSESYKPVFAVNIIGFIVRGIGNGVLLEGVYAVNRRFALLVHFNLQRRHRVPYAYTE